MRVSDSADACEIISLKDWTAQKSKLEDLERVIRD